MILTVDWSVGQVMETLKELGFDRNALIIFSSDNGPVSERSTGGFRGSKWRVFDGGFRVPFIARWPEKIRPATQSDQLLCLTDVLATFAAVTGQTLPDGVGEDSFNMLPALLDSGHAQSIRPYSVHQSAIGSRAFKSGDWTIIFDPTDGRIGSEKHPLYNVITKNPGQLYNCREDPGERTDLWTHRPDVVQRLTQELDACKQAGRSRPRR